ncbi:hypothetical protein D3C85_650590 [compost metagenome]
MASGNFTLTNTLPNMVLQAVSPDDAPAEFASVIIGPKGDKGDTGSIGDIGATDDLGGFTTNPTVYYILAST